MWIAVSETGLDPALSRFFFNEFTSYPLSPAAEATCKCYSDALIVYCVNCVIVFRFVSVVVVRLVSLCCCGGSGGVGGGCLDGSRTGSASGRGRPQ